jgi:Phosphatidylethanolamine-binding protein
VVRLPSGALQLPNDARLARFIGGGPPPGDGRHRYVIVVQAIGIEKVGQLQVRADSTPAWLGFSINLSGHLLGRAVITPFQIGQVRVGHESRAAADRGGGGAVIRKPRNPSAVTSSRMDSNFPTPPE